MLRRRVEGAVFRRTGAGRSNRRSVGGGDRFDGASSSRDLHRQQRGRGAGVCQSRLRPGEPADSHEGDPPAQVSSHVHGSRPRRERRRDPEARKCNHEAPTDARGGRAEVRPRARSTGATLESALPSCLDLFSSPWPQRRYSTTSGDGSAQLVIWPENILPAIRGSVDVRPLRGHTRRTMSRRTSQNAPMSLPPRRGTK